MKGIILAGGSGTRLYPLSLGIVKQLLPIYNKPMIYYPLSILMTAGIKEILIISTPEDTSRFEKLFGSGSQLGLKFEYIVQPEPKGLAQAFTLGKQFLNGEDACLILGDNIFYGHNLPSVLEKSIQIVAQERKSVIFGYHVEKPESYGVIEFDSKGNVLSIEEKPSIPKSNYAQTGLYFYPSNVTNIAESLTPSKRGEYEITDINQIYLTQNKLHVEILGRGYAWLDTGTPENLLEASNFVKAIEHRQGLKISCIEEIAYNKNYINQEQLLNLIKPIEKTQYGQYLLKISKEKPIYL